MANASDGDGWSSYLQGQPNPHLTNDQREAIERLNAELAERRGPQVARVVVDVFESGEAIPQVQLLVPDAANMVEDAARVVAQAAAALANWR